MNSTLTEPQQRCIKEMTENSVLAKSDGWIAFHQAGEQVCIDGWYSLEEVRLILKIMEAINVMV